MSTFKKSSLRWWRLFDFANSIPIILLALAFSKRFLEDMGASELLYNAIFMISSLIIILLGRYIGTKIDTSGYQSRIKISLTISAFALFVLFGINILSLSSEVQIRLAFLLIIISNFGYHIGRICHNSYLRGHIPEEVQSKMSGLWTAANWGGSVLGILLFIVIMKFFPWVFGHEISLFIGAIIYALLSLIAIVLMSRSPQLATVHLAKETIDSQTRKSLLKTSGMILLSYFLLFETMITVERNLPPYLDVMFNLGSTTKSLAFLVVVVFALIGGLIAAKVINFSNANKWLKIGSLSLAVGILFIGLGNTIGLLTSVIIAGLSYGILETAIRTHFMNHFSPENAGKNFGVLAIVERTSGTIWPLLWIIPFSFLGEKSAYLLAMRLMAGLALIAFGLLMGKKK